MEGVYAGGDRGRIRSSSCCVKAGAISATMRPTRGSDDAIGDRAVAAARIMRSQWHVSQCCGWVLFGPVDRLKRCAEASCANRPTSHAASSASGTWTMFSCAPIAATLTSSSSRDADGRRSQRNISTRLQASPQPGQGFGGHSARRRRGRRRSIAHALSRAQSLEPC